MTHPEGSTTLSNYVEHSFQLER